MGTRQTSRGASDVATCKRGWLTPPACRSREIATAPAGPRNDGGNKHRHREARSAVAQKRGARWTAAGRAQRV